MGEFRIGRKHAQHSYPTPRAIAGTPPSLLQVGSDLIDQTFAISGNQPDPIRVAKSGGLLQVPLPGFRRINGLWMQASVFLGLDDTGDVSISYVPWVKFASLPQFFIPDPAQPNVGANLSFVTGGGTQPFVSLTLTLDFMVQLPAQSSDVAPIAIPAVDDILVGIAGQATKDFDVISSTIITVGEIDDTVITQHSPIGLVTLL